MYLGRSRYIKMAIRLGIVSGLFAMALIYPFGAPPSLSATASLSVCMSACLPACVSVCLSLCVRVCGACATGPYVMKHLYLEGKPHVLSLATTYLPPHNGHAIHLSAESVCEYLWPCYDMACTGCRYLYIHTIGMSLDYLCGVGSGVVQGMQQLKYYCFLGFFESLYQGFSNWMAINVLGWGIAGSAAAHVSRKCCMFVLIYGYLYRLFKREARETAQSEMWSAKAPTPPNQPLRSAPRLTLTYIYTHSYTLVE